MIEVGKKAPAFSLESSDGGSVKLADFAGKTVVLYFYPLDNTPGCTVEAEGFRDAVPALEPPCSGRDAARSVPTGPERSHG